MGGHRSVPVYYGLSVSKCCSSCVWCPEILDSEENSSVREGECMQLDAAEYYTCLIYLTVRFCSQYLDPLISTPTRSDNEELQTAWCLRAACSYNPDIYLYHYLHCADGASEGVCCSTQDHSFGSCQGEVLDPTHSCNDAESTLTCVVHFWYKSGS